MRPVPRRGCPSPTPPRVLGMRSIHRHHPPGDSHAHTASLRPAAGGLRRRPSLRVRRALDFQTTQLDGQPAGFTPRFDGGAGALTVSGTLSTPCIGQPVGGALDAGGAELVLTVQPRPVDGCLTAIGYRAYTARVTGLEPGVYRVRVVYPARGENGIVAGQADVRVR